MFYYNKLLKKSVTNYKINFSAFQKGMDSNTDEGILPIKYAKRCYNFKIKSGALENCIGFEALSLPKSYQDLTDERTIYMMQNQEVKAIWLYKYFDEQNNRPDYRLLYYTTDGKIRWFQLIAQHPYTFEIASLIYSSKVPNAVNYRLDGVDTMIFSSKTEGMWKYDALTMAEEVEGGPCLVSMCLHYERMFAILENGERNRLVFSENLDPTNFNESLTEGGFIDMLDERGKLNKVLSFNDYVYVFRDFGVSRISAYGDQTAFNVSHMFISSSKIYENSVCTCGDRIMFLSKDGLHYFDGYNTHKLEIRIEELLEGTNNENCSSLFFDGKYYLALKLNWNDGESIGCEAYNNGYTNNAILEYDLKTGEVCLSRGIDICSFALIDDGNISKVVACFNGEYKNLIGQMTKDGKMFGNTLKRCWTSPMSNVGFPTKTKRVKEILIKTKSNCQVKIKTDIETKTYTAIGSNKTQRLKTNVKGEQIEISFISQESGETEISCPQILIGITS